MGNLPYVPKVGTYGSSLSKKSSYGWAFSYRYGKMSMGDERCLNEGSWIAES